MVRLLLISAGSPSIGNEGDKQLHNHIFRLIGQRLEHAERLLPISLSFPRDGNDCWQIFQRHSIPEC
jgi:hypothetical protein